MKTPDITTAQVVACVQAALAVGAAFGLNLTQTQQTSLIALSGLIFTALCAADAHIRHGRAMGKTNNG